MPKKLFTLSELVDYLGIDADEIIDFVDAGVIPAYKIAGELLRFQKEQIDAIRAEIDAKIKNKKKPFIKKTPKIEKVSTKPKRLVSSLEGDTFSDKVSDFFYFNDFYIFSGVFIVLLLIVIFRG